MLGGGVGESAVSAIGCVFAAAVAVTHYLPHIHIAGTYDVNVLVAGRDITGKSAIKAPTKGKK